MKHHEMFDNMLKCQRDRFWAQNLILDAISNWILKKYSEATDCKLLNHNCISVYFYNPKADTQDEIIKNVCKEFALQLRFIKQGCSLDCKENTTKKFREYILYRNYENEWKYQYD